MSKPNIICRDIIVYEIKDGFHLQRRSSMLSVSKFNVAAPLYCDIFIYTCAGKPSPKRYINPQCNRSFWHTLFLGSMVWEVGGGAGGGGGE